MEEIAQQLTVSCSHCKLGFQHVSTILLVVQEFFHPQYVICETIPARSARSAARPDPDAGLGTNAKDGDVCKWGNERTDMGEYGDLMRVNNIL